MKKRYFFLLVFIATVLLFTSCVSNEESKVEVKKLSIVNNDTIIVKDEIKTYKAIVEPSFCTSSIEWQILNNDKNYLEIVSKGFRTVSIKACKEGGENLILKAICDNQEYSLKNIKTIDKINTELIIKNKNNKVLTGGAPKILDFFSFI